MVNYNKVYHFVFHSLLSYSLPVLDDGRGDECFGKYAQQNEFIL